MQVQIIQHDPCSQKSKYNPTKGYVLLMNLYNAQIIQALHLGKKNCS